MKTLPDLEAHLLIVYLAIACVVGMLGGAVLILKPDWMARFGRLANRWVSTRSVERSLERTIDFDRWFYRHARVGGVLLLSGACWIIVYFAVYFDKAKLASLLSPANPVDLQYMGRFLNGFVAIALAAGVFAAIVSLFLLFRPSLLRDFEKGANRWISTRRALYPLDATHQGVDQYVLKHYRLVGILVLLACLYMLGAVGLWVR